jgi:Contractile injection system tube protein
MALTKLTIAAYKSDAYNDPVGGASFTVQINPESWKEEFRVNYSPSAAIGGTATKLRLKNIGSSELSLNLVFDGTGLVSTTPDSLQGVSVADQITSFKNLALKINGDIHQPNYLVLTWGNFSFRGLLTKLSIDYPIISMTGEPLRAKATATFKSSESPANSNAAAGLNSPDMTHRRKVNSGNTLSQMTFDIYGDPQPYILVARHNDLNQVRQAPLGSELEFPPLKKN